MESRSIPAALLSFILLAGAMCPCESAEPTDSFPVSSRTEAVAIAARDAERSIVPAIESTDLRFGRGELREPLGLAVDARGFVYVADAMTGKVFRYSAGGESLEFEKPSDLASLYPIDVAAHGTFIYVLDYIENKVLRFDYRGAFIDIILSFGEFASMHPSSMSTSAGGRLVTTDIRNHTVTIWTPLINFEFSLGEYGWAEGKLDRPMKAIFLDDDRIAVAESGNRRIQIFSPAGRFEKLLEPPPGGAFRLPRSISTDRMGNIFVADTEAEKFVVYSPDGEFYFEVDSFGGDKIRPAAVAVGWNDHVYIADIESRSILVYRLRYPS